VASAANPDQNGFAELEGGVSAVSVPSVSTHPSDARRRRLLQLLQRLIGIRLLVVTSIVLPYLLLRLNRPEIPLTFDLLLQIATSAYAASLIYVALLGVLRRRPVWQAYIQFSGDLVLVTGLVYFFGGITSSFSLLYLVVIMVASVFLGRRGGLIVATSAYILYGGLLTALARGWVPQLMPVLTAENGNFWRLPYNLLVHLFGFYAVAFLTSYLAESVRRVEAELEEQRDTLADLEAFHHDVVQSLSTGIVTTDTAGRITSANRAALEILGRREEELIGGGISVVGLMDDEGWRALMNRADAEEMRRRAETEIRRGDVTVPIGYSVSRLTDGSGASTGMILIFQDLTQWRVMEEELRLKDRMAAVGELSAGLAHEVGNPLAAIAGSVQLLSQSLPEDDSERKLLEIILRESQRLDRTIKGFLRFARPRERSTASFDIAALLAESTELLRNSEESGGLHDIRLEIDPPAAQLVGDRDQISQIFWNLARNALRAMPGGGVLTIRGRVVGERYSLEVMDTGHGMTDEQRTRLFQPFRSFFDSGTGIGMAIVYRIVQEHGGRVEVDSGRGRGTRIRVELPLRLGAPALAEV